MTLARSVSSAGPEKMFIRELIVTDSFSFSSPHCALHLPLLPLLLHPPWLRPVVTGSLSPSLSRVTGALSSASPFDRDEDMAVPWILHNANAGVVVKCVRSCINLEKKDSLGIRTDFID